MTRRLLLTALFASLLIFWSIPSRNVSAVELTIGSPAPAIDIEHWIQDGNGFFEPVTEFEADRVYVLEFWATWCAPCIANMPHIAELQNKYRGRGVQVIGVSDETVDEVQQLLQQKHPEADKTFAEITSAYSLTTDPDLSVYEDYMEASGQMGIPTAFIVGKDSKIEWIGHPAEIDEALEAVVTDSWDRSKYIEEMNQKRQLQEMLTRVDRLVSTEKYDEAFELIESQIEDAPNEMLRLQWTSIKNDVKFHTGRTDEEVLAHYRNQLEQMGTDPQTVAGFGFWLYGAHQQGANIEALAGDTVSALRNAIKQADEERKPALYNVIARLLSVTNDFEGAAKAQQAAVDLSSDTRQQRRLTPLLEELRAKALKAKEETDGQ